MNILITGASGFVGKALSQKLKIYGNIIATDRECPTDGSNQIKYQKVDIANSNHVADLFKSNKPDIVIHCAGIAHQKIGSIDLENYLSVNSYATERIAKIAGLSNPDIHFIFLSSISVYGENNNNAGPIIENCECNPTSDYACSKLDAEQRLVGLFEQGRLNKLDILRLAPVYDYEWSLNLERRVLGPWKKFYIRFGLGNQEMSAVSRQNLIAFIESLMTANRKLGARHSNLYNVCDERSYSFNKIIEIFKSSKQHQDKPVLIIPLPIVWILTRIGGLILKSKRSWLHSCYDKLAKDLVFDNTKMLMTGFKPIQTLKEVFDR